MVTITLRCDDESCPGTVHFERRAAGRKPGHLLGWCDECRQAYDLYGGQARCLGAAPESLTSIS